MNTGDLISYLFEEKAYQRSIAVRINVVDALKLLRLAAIRYSTPSSIKEVITNFALTQIVEEYCLLSMKFPLKDKEPPNNKPNLNLDLTEVRMFLQLYKPVSGT